MTLKQNGGTIKTTKKSNVKGYGEVWFDEQDITKILALNNFKRKFRVTYEISNAGISTVHNPRGQDVHFKIHKDVLHYKNNKNRHVTLVQTVSKNEAGYSKRQLNSEKLARGIYAKVGHLYQNNFKNLINSNLIRN